MASSQPSVAEYFAKGDNNRVVTDKKESDGNPNKRTHSELSSTGSEVSDALNQRILDELNIIKSELKKRVKKDDLEAVVRDTVKDMLTGVKAEMEKKMTEQEKRYDKR